MRLDFTAELNSVLQLRMIDAPVSGGVGGAEAGTLTFMVGGTAPDYDSARSVLASMGKNIVRTKHT